MNLNRIRMALGACLALLVACDSGGDDGFFDDAGVDLPVEGLCFEACTALDGCGACDTDAAGECYGRVQCIEVCEQAGSHDRFACLTGTSGCSGPLSQCGGFCNAADIQGCIDGSAVTDCHTACGTLEACDACVNDANGNCLSTAGCITSCESGEAAEGYACVAALNVCDDNAIAECFAGGGVNPGDDACAQGCVALDECELALSDEDGNNLDIEQCVAACRGADEALDADRAQCIADLNACDPDGIDGCLNAEPDPGDDACGQGCGRLDACELCLPGEDPEECLSAVQCAESCRAGENAEALACIAELDACDQEAIDACLRLEPDPGDDACAQGCTNLDGCGFCIPGEGEDDCLSVVQCAESCREGTIAPTVQCLAMLEEGCDEEAIDACFELGPDPGDDVCGTGCSQLDACGYCLTDEADECIDVVACAEACRGGQDVDTLACVGNLEECSDEAVEMCFDAPPPQAPSCDLYCERRADCEEIGPMERAGFLASCVADCAAVDDAELRTCYVEAENCEAAAACEASEPEPEPAPEPQPEPEADGGVPDPEEADAGMGE